MGMEFITLCGLVKCSSSKLYLKSYLSNLIYFFSSTSLPIVTDNIPVLDHMPKYKCTNKISYSPINKPLQIFRSFDSNW